MKPINDLLDDRSRFIAVMSILSENFVDKWINFLGDTCYPREYTEVVEQYSDHQHKTISKFFNQKINDTYKKLNTAFDNLKEYVYSHFNAPQGHYKTYESPPFFYLMPSFHPKFRLDEINRDTQVSEEQDNEKILRLRPKHRSEKQDFKKWNKYKNELDELVKTFKQSYEEFITTARKEIESVALAGSPVQKNSLKSIDLVTKSLEPTDVIFLVFNKLFEIPIRCAVHNNNGAPAYIKKLYDIAYTWDVPNKKISYNKFLADNINNGLFRKRLVAKYMRTNKFDKPTLVQKSEDGKSLVLKNEITVKTALVKNIVPLQHQSLYINKTK